MAVVLSFSSPSSRRVTSIGESVAENNMAEAAALKIGAMASRRVQTHQRQPRARRRFSTTHAKPGPNKFKIAMNRCQAKCKSTTASSASASLTSRFQER